MTRVEIHYLRILLNRKLLHNNRGVICPFYFPEMTDKQELQTLLEKRLPLSISENKLSLLQRLRIRKKQYTIEVKPFPLGVVYQIIDSLTDIVGGLPDSRSSIKERAEFVAKNRNAVDRVIAFALNCNSDQQPPDHLFKFIRRNIPSDQVGNVFTFIIIQADLKNFTSAISLATRKLVADSEAGQKSSE